MKKYETADMIIRTGGTTMLDPSIETAAASSAVSPEAPAWAPAEGTRNLPPELGVETREGLCIYTSRKWRNV